MELYDPTRHILLRDEAHKRRIHEEAEFQEYLHRLQNAEQPEGYPEGLAKPVEIFEVEIPDFPPARRSPLALIMGVSVDGSAPDTSGPFAGMDWTGVQPACERSWWNEREVQRIGVEMVPHEEIDLPHRESYMWQVPIFDPTKHVRARAWALENGVDEVDLFMAFDRIRDETPGAIVETTNPYRFQEVEQTGQWTPTVRSFQLWAIPAMQDRFMEGRESVIPEVPPIPGWNYADYVSPQPPPPPAPPPMPEPAPVRKASATRQPEREADHGYIAKGAVFYEAHVVARALQERLGRQVTLFGGQAADKAITAMTREAVAEFLKRDATDSRTYVADIGGRNFDCDDFAVLLRAGLSKRGMNCCGIVWGNQHAWNFFVLAGESGPEFLFVEPQTDAAVGEMSGEYAITRRCEVYL